MLPEGWIKTSVAEIGTVIRGASPRPQGDPRYYNGPVPRLMVEDVSRDGKYVTPKVDSLTFKGAQKSRPVPAGTLTMVCSGVVGVPAITAIDCCIHDGFLAIIDIQDFCNKEYLYEVFSSLSFQLDASATHGGIFTNLTTSILKEFEVHLPPILEQQKIVSILSIWDRAIAVQEQLIANAKAQKKALLQNLIVRKKRIPEFTGKLKMLALRDISDISYGTSPSGVAADCGTIPIVGTGGIVGWTHQRTDDGPAIIIGRKGTIDKPQLISGPFWAIDTAYFCKPKPGYDLVWLYYNIQLLDFRSLNEASGVPSLSRETLYAVTISVPEFKEQQRIGEIIQKADSYISSLTKQANILRQEKSALMQQLLTGKRRVKIEETV